MKIITLITGVLLSGMAFSQFFSESRAALGVVYSPMLPFSDRQESMINYYDYSDFNYNPAFRSLPAYSQSLGMKLTIAPTENLHMNFGVVYSNRQQHFEQITTLDDFNDYYYNDASDTLLNFNYGGNFAEMHGEIKQTLYRPGRFSVFYTFGAGFSMLLGQKVTIDARPFEGPVIKDYKTVFEAARHNNLLMHTGIGFDYEISESLFLTTQVQYVFYSPGEFYGFPYTVHTGRINIGLNYWIF